MTKQARRRLVPIIVILAAAGIMISILYGPKRNNPNEEVTTPTTIVEAIDDSPNTKVIPALKQEDVVKTSLSNAASPVGTLALQTFEVTDQQIALGSLYELDKWKMEAVLTSAGAGIESIRFSNIFETVDGKLSWNKYRGSGGTQPPMDDLYLLATARELQYQTADGIASATASVLGASQVMINDQALHLTSPTFWNLSSYDGSSTATFEAVVIDENKKRVATIRRSWTLDDQYGLNLEQTITNHTSDMLNIRWLQYGPQSLTVDRSRYMDRRRFRFGWELSDEFDPSHAAPIQANDFLYEYADVTKQDGEPIWPTEETLEDGFKLSWFASTNRYFAITVFPPVNNEGVGSRILTDKVESISSQVYGSGDDEFILTALWSPTTSISAGNAYDLSLGIYAGPMQRSTLDYEEPYVALNMRDLVLYQMSSMCAICTFQWLADFLATVLTFLDQYVVFDWGLAIIFLVLIVRGLLHPITKKSQINMQRFGKVMQKIKPEIEKIKQKHPNDPKKVQSEQMMLMQKYGVNPFQMLGCLPMFLQMPVWVALYALLYFMFDIRQEPAFFGVFQYFNDWPFLADLSASDHFFGQFAEPKHFLLWNITGINILPLLMGLIFFVQQKYMSPQNMATTPEQVSQQKVMKVMMVVMFPLMLYSAPSGLTLYILTSSSVGILESRRIRKHVDSIEIEPKSPTTAEDSKRKPKDKQARAWADAMEARRKKVQNKAKKRNFKKRD